jgi:hypothetical protein
MLNDTIRSNDASDDYPDTTSASTPSIETESSTALTGFQLPTEVGSTSDTSGTESGAAGSAEGIGQKQMLLSVTRELELWRDLDGEAFVTILCDGKTSNVRLRSRDLRNHLCRLVYRNFKLAPSSQALEDVIRVLEGKARYDGPEWSTHVRVAGDANATYLHLANAEGTVLRIDAQGVHALDASDAYSHTFKFLTKPGMRSLPKPVIPFGLQEVRDVLDELRRFCNLKDDAEWLLFLVTMLSAYRPAGPFVVVVVVGEQGSAKSTLCKIFRKLVDPSAAPLRSAPREERDLWIAANNGWVVVFDNVSHIKPDLSDAICRLASGGGNSYRTLYENDSETLFQAQRLVLLNTIDDLSLRGDLIDRGIQLTCQRIDDADRKPEPEFWAGFDARSGKFLGSLLFVLSRTLKELPDVILDRSPRMADFARFGVAVERALELTSGAFLSAYQNNRMGLAAVALDTHLTQLVLGLELPLDKSPTELWNLIHERAGFHGDKPQRWFPTNPQQLSSRLRRLAPFFRQRGLDIEFGQSGSRTIRLNRLQDKEV